MPREKLKPRADGRYRKIVDGVSFYGTSEREVFQKIKDYTAEKELGRTFKAVADEWWEIEVMNLAPSSIKGYEKAFERVIDFFGNKRIKEIETGDITSFLYDLGKRQGFAKKTVKNHKIVLNGIFHFAVAAKKELPYNPVREAEIPRGLKETPRLPAHPVEERIIAASPNTAELDDFWLLPFMAIFTGMRKGELRGLKWSDIDMKHKLIHVNRSVWDGGGTYVKPPKTNAGTRTIPIPEVLFEELQKTIEKKSPPSDHYVFGDENPISEKRYRYRYEKFKKQTGITATAQQLRKSYATMAVAANLPHDVLASIFGHKDITTTLNIYNQVREDRIIAAGETLNHTPLSKSAKT